LSIDEAVVLNVSRCSNEGEVVVYDGAGDVYCAYNTTLGTDTDTTYSAGNGIAEASEVFTVAGNMGLTQDADGLSIDESVVLNNTWCETAGEMVVVGGSGFYCINNESIGGGGVSAATWLNHTHARITYLNQTYAIPTYLNHTYARTQYLNRSGTLTDAKWCSYASATGVISCNENAPGAGAMEPNINAHNVTA